MDSSLAANDAPSPGGEKVRQEEADREVDMDSLSIGKTRRKMSLQNAQKPVTSNMAAGLRLSI
jgi:hypothetical protein